MFSNVLNTQNKKIISIVGAGGKTSLMFLLAKELSKSSKVLITTTTKIYMPQENQYDYIAIGKPQIQNYLETNKKGIYIFGNKVNKQNKLLGVSCEFLDKIKGYFDYILVEADGSKRKPLKGWRDFEPVICNSTDMTIGVVDIKAIGKKATPENVFCLEEFLKLCDIKKGENIRVDHITKVILHPTGLFKCAMGEKVVYINKVENADDKVNCNSLVTNLIKTNKIDHIISGSIINNKFTLEF